MGFNLTSLCMAESVFSHIHLGDSNVADSGTAVTARVIFIVSYGFI